MSKTFRLLGVFLLLTILLSACNMPRAGATQLSPGDAARTAAVQTVEAFSTQNAKNTQAVAPTAGLPTLPPTAPPPPTVVIPTAPLPTLVPTIAIPTPVPVPCDRATFETDVTIPDGATVSAGASFTKTWRLRNNGSCSWTPSYKLVFDGGTAMDGPAAIPLAGNVNPGQSIDISVTLKAPAAAGTYTGYWKLQNASGARFGLGTSGDKAFWVKIVVGGTSEPSGVFAVTSVSTDASPAAYAGACPVVINFTAKITVNKAGTIKFRWERSDGAHGPWQELDYGSAGHKTVSTTWTLGGPGVNYSGWQRIYVDDPNNQGFGKADFSIACSP